MMTWKQKEEEGRFFSITAWTWNRKSKEYDRNTIANDLTFDEAKEILNRAKVTPNTPQYDLWEDHKDTAEKLLVKDEYGIYDSE